MTPARLRNVLLIIFGLWALVLLVLWLLPEPAKPPPADVNGSSVRRTQTAQALIATNQQETASSELALISTVSPLPEATDSSVGLAASVTAGQPAATLSGTHAHEVGSPTPTLQATQLPTAGPSPTITPQYDATLAARLVELRGEWAGMATVKVNRQPRIKLRQVVLKFEQYCVMGQVCATLRDDSGKASALVLYRIRGRTVSLRSIDLAFSERCKNPMVFTLAPRRDGGQTLTGSCTDLDGLAVSWSATLYAR